MSLEPLVYVVDDDEHVRNALRLLIHTANLNVETYACAEDFLAHARTDRPACLVLDLNMPSMNGLDLQARLAAKGAELPIIMLTGHGNVPSAVRAMQGGAVDFLQKPVKGDVLLERIQQAIERAIDQHRGARERADLAEQFARLTPREREVMELIVAGKANKLVATELDISERTAELHRSRVMRKMKAGSLAELMSLVLSVDRNGKRVEDDQERLEGTTPLGLASK